MRFRQTTDVVESAERSCCVFPTPWKLPDHAASATLLTHQFVNSCNERQYSRELFTQSVRNSKQR